jgi:hypothetical protein
MPEAHASCPLLHESSSHNLPAVAEASQESSTSLTASASAATASPSSTPHSNRKSRENTVKKSGGERGAAKGTARAPDVAASLHAPKAITHKVEPLVSLKGQLQSPVFVAICFILMHEFIRRCSLSHFIVIFQLSIDRLTGNNGRGVLTCFI